MEFRKSLSHLVLVQVAVTVQIDRPEHLCCLQLRITIELRRRQRRQRQQAVAGLNSTPLGGVGIDTLGAIGEYEQRYNGSAGLARYRRNASK